MPYAQSEGARIYYEETGAGTPILFIHEFAGDIRSWEDQVRYFGRGWRCLAWSCRGYPPSDCPEDESLYGQEFFNRDAIAVLDAAKVDVVEALQPFLCGLQHRGRCIHRDDARDERRERGADLAGAAAQVPDGPLAARESRERRQVKAIAEEVVAHAIPLARRR